MKIRRCLVAVLALCFLGISIARAAQRPAAEQAKIDWLLGEVERSDAIFIRNGKEYDAKKAVSHLRTKLLFAGKRVQTARDFIEGIASRSQESGKPYQIRFPDGRTKLVGAWLRERLAALEHGQLSSPTPPARSRA